MPKGPNSFFIAPDSDFIINGTISSSDDATGLYASKTVAADANSGSMSSFVIGTPESNTTYQLKIQNSGSNYSGTYIQKTVGTSGSDDTLVWNGEPDRRFIWDVHNPLLKNYTEVLNYSSTSPPTNYYWEDSLTNETANNIQGVYFSVLNKEFLYVSRFENMMPRLYVASRNIKNYEQSWTKEAEITTLSASTLQPFYNISNIDIAKRGLNTAYEPVYSICEHIDGKLKLAVKFNDEIDIYETSDGVSFNLIARNILSRFKGKRFVNDLKIASSGPYLKIVFVVSNSGFGKSTIKKWIGSLSSSDGGASWDYSDVANSKDQGGAGFNVLLSNASFGNQNYSYDLCGLSDGSGRFILAYSRDYAKEDVGIALQSTINLGYPSAFVAFAVSSGNARFEIKEQLSVHNLGLSAKPYLACSNDWIWLVMGGVKNPVGAGFERRGTYGSGSQQFAGAALASQNGEGWNYYIQPNTRENSMFYLRIDSDLNKDKWKNLGDDKTSIPIGGETWFFPSLKSSKTTDGIGSYFFIPASGNLYSCGPYISFCGIGWPQWNDSLEDLTNNVADLGSFNRFAQYYRFSGWMLRPPYINLGLNTLSENIIDMVDKFSQQEKGIISIAEFNYIWGKPVEVNVNGNSKFKSLWGQRRIGTAFLQLREDSLHFKELPSAAVAYQCNYYYYRCPTVADANHWTMGAGQRVGSLIIAQAAEDFNDTDVRYPMFPLGMKVTDSFESGLSSWIQPKKKKLFSEHTDGSCIQFVFGGVQNGSTSRNSIGIKINSFTRGSQVPAGITDDAFLYEYFLRMSQNSLALYNTSKDSSTSYYRESTATLINTLTLGASFGASDFSNSFWEGRLSFHINRESFLHIISIVFSVRLLGTETWQDSTVVQKYIDTQGLGVAVGSDGYKFLGIQGISFGLFPDSASTVSRQVKFRSLKVCQGSDMMHAQMIINNSNSTFTPSVNLIRGRMLAPNPAYLGSGQSVSWGGIGGKFGDLFDTKIKSSYNVENTIKVSSPRFEYRTKGDNTSNLKASVARAVYQLPDETRTANALGNYGLYHTGLAILNTNVEKIKIEYCDLSDFSSDIYTVGEKSLKLIQGRTTDALNNKIVVTYDGESSARNPNDTSYTSSDSVSYYLKFTTGSLAHKSYKITKTNGANVILDCNDEVLDTTKVSVGTTIQIYSDRMVSTYSQFPTANKYMRVTLTCHLGTTDYIKMGSLCAGTSFSLERVPINWEHSVGVAGNVTEFNSRSGVRWGYREGPSVRTFSGEIIGDVFDDERENIKNIAEQATRFNSYPVAMIFDGDRGAAFDTVGDDASAKAFIDPTNVLYGTINPELEMVNEGWRYDETNSEWKVVGNLQLTVIEVV